MAIAKNDITGDSIISKASTPEYEENRAKIFKNDKPQSGKWVYDKDTRKMVPADEFYARNPKPRRRGVFKGAAEFEAFESPATGEIITNEKKRQYDLKSSGCREWEGLEIEEQETALFRKYEEEKFEKTIEEGVEETFYDLKHKRIEPETHIDTGWLADE